MRIALITGGVALIPQILNFLFSFLDKCANRRAEIATEKRRFFTDKRMVALQEYFKCLCAMDTEHYSRDAFCAFFAAHAHLSLFVTQETLAMMEILVKKFEIAIADDHFQHPDFNAYGFSLNLVRQLNAELNVAEEYKKFYGGKNKRNRIVNGRESSEDFHSFFP